MHRSAEITEEKSYANSEGLPRHCALQHPLIFKHLHHTNGFSQRFQLPPHSFSQHWLSLLEVKCKTLQSGDFALFVAQDHVKKRKYRTLKSLSTDLLVLKRLVLLRVGSLGTLMQAPPEAA